MAACSGYGNDVSVLVYRVGEQQLRFPPECLYAGGKDGDGGDHVLVSGDDIPVPGDNVQFLVQGIQVALVVQFNHPLVGRKGDAVRRLAPHFLCLGGSELNIDSRQVGVFQEGAIPVHHHPADPQSLQEPVLHRDVSRRIDHPGVDTLKPSGVIPRLVGHCLTVRIGEVTVSEEVHAGHRVSCCPGLQGIPELHRSRLVQQDPGRGEINGSETCITEESVRVCTVGGVVPA